MKSQLCTVLLTGILIFEQSKSAVLQDFRRPLASRRCQSAGSRLQCPGGSIHDTHVLVVLHMYMWCVLMCLGTHVYMSVYKHVHVCTEA